MRVKYTESIEYKALTRLKAIRGSAVLRKNHDVIIPTGSYDLSLPKIKCFALAQNKN